MALDFPPGTLCSKCAHWRCSRPHEQGGDGLVSRIACERQLGTGLTDVRSGCKDYSSLSQFKKVA